MSEKLAMIWPEMILLLGACGCLALGLSSSAPARRATGWLAGAALVLAGIFTWISPVGLSSEAMLPEAMTRFVKLAIVVLGLLLLMVTAGTPGRLRQTRDTESRQERGLGFEPGNAMGGEFFAFFLFSLTGAMLCAGASDLVWLFMALELTSLPTYVMVATTREQPQAREAAVKYFFLGALAAAVFLYGFTLIYGVTGSTDFTAIRHAIETTRPLPTLLIVGLVLAVIGVSFKIAAAPMHFYAADVYEGAAVPVTAFLAIVPKTAGFVTLIGLLGLTGYLSGPGYEPVSWVLWVMAVATMTIGNVLGLLQQNVKRLLAYSSVAHSGYMLVGLIAAGSAGDGDPALGNGIAAVLFYLVAYSLATLGAFAVLGCVERDGDEAQTFDDIAGLGHRRPLAGAIVVVSALSLIGLPPLVGFMGKIYLFGSAIQHGYISLVVIAVLNSAVSAVYYLRIVAACYFGDSAPAVTIAPLNARWIGAAIACLAAVLLGLGGGSLVRTAKNASITPTLTTPALVSSDTQ